MVSTVRPVDLSQMLDGLAGQDQGSGQDVVDQMIKALDMDTSHGRFPGWSPGQVGPVFREAVWPSPGAVRARVSGGLGSLGFDWDVFSDVFAQGTQFTTDILRLRPPPGTYQQTYVDPRTGQIVQTSTYRGGPGGYGGGFPGAGFGGSGWLLPALLIGGVLLLATRGGR